MNKPQKTPPTPPMPPAPPTPLHQTFPIVDHPEIFETFVDSIGNSIFDGHSLRIDLTIARYGAPKPPTPLAGNRHVACRLALTPQACVELFNQLTQAMTVMARQGLLQQTAPQPAGRA